MEYDMRTDPHVMEIDARLRKHGELPTIPEVLPSGRFTLDQVVDMFPHCWVFMVDPKFDRFGNLIDAALSSVSYYKDDELEDYSMENNLIYEYTSFGDGRNKCYRGYE